MICSLQAAGDKTNLRQKPGSQSVVLALLPPGDASLTGPALRPDSLAHSVQQTAQFTGTEQTLWPRPGHHSQSSSLLKTLPPVSSSKKKAFSGAVEGEKYRVQDFGPKLTTGQSGDYNAQRSQTSMQEASTAHMACVGGWGPEDFLSGTER